MPPLNLKQEFPSLKSFKQALYIWAIEDHFEPRILKSDSHHVRVGCKFDPKCEFSIRCNAYNTGPRVTSPFAKITVLRHDHTCTPGDPSNPLNRQVANRIPWLVENVPRFLDVTPTTTIESIQEAILTHSGYTVNLQQIRRVRRILVKGKDFRSPRRDHASQQHSQQQHSGQQQQSHNALSHNPHNPHNQHHSQHNGVNPQNVNGGGGGHAGHAHSHTPSQHTSSTVNSTFVTSRQVNEPHDPHHPNHSTSPSSLLQDTLNPSSVNLSSSSSNPNHSNPADDFNHSAAAVRLASQFEDHSQLITALADQASQVGGVSVGGVGVQSNNMFDVSNSAPPPRLLEGPPPVGLERLDRGLSGRASISMSVNGGVGVGGQGQGQGGGGAGQSEQPQRCPFCVNVKWMKSIKEAVEHMSVHVV